MLDFMRNMLKTFKAIDRPAIRDSANFILSVILIREVAVHLNLTHAYAAEIVGAMKIEVQDSVYSQDPELFHDLAKELARIMGLMFTAYSDALGETAALAYIKAGAKDMSLTANF